jgi:hypothetical protein
MMVCRAMVYAFTENLTSCAELLVRTSHLLFALEKSLVQEDNSSGQAVVFGSFG